MKKFLVIAFAAVMCGSANAQIVSSTTREITATSKPAKAPSNKLHYLQASVGFLNQSGDGAKDLESATGFDFLYGYEKPLGNAGVWWGMEIGVGTSRGCYNSYSYGSTKIENTLLTYSLRWMPLNFGYRHKINDDFAIEGHLGAGVSVDFAGCTTVESGGNSETTSIWDIKNGDESWMPADVMLKIGAGVSYKCVGVDISWQKGFLESIKDNKQNASNVFLGVRYIF